MLILLSPAKTLDYDAEKRVPFVTQPELLARSKLLVKTLRTYNVADLKKLMQVSDAIAALNEARYQAFKTPFTEANARAAIEVFRGDVYTGLAADDFTEKDYRYAQDHLRILSGLYGVLRPLD
ncbi:MAG: peroxide stress protein YaaA, partial [Rickettsiales bacterium]|nr:peroxide stress protein YaaA [Rickettsiales bacterium]